MPIRIVQLGSPRSIEPESFAILAQAGHMQRDAAQTVEQILAQMPLLDPLGQIDPALS